MGVVLDVRSSVYVIAQARNASRSLQAAAEAVTAALFAAAFRSSDCFLPC